MFCKVYYTKQFQTVPTSKVESEFWRLVNSTDDEVVVKYGADVHSMDQGSGFPMKTEDDKEITVCIDTAWILHYSIIFVLLFVIQLLDTALYYIIIFFLSLLSNGVTQMLITTHGYCTSLIHCTSLIYSCTISAL